METPLPSPAEYITQYIAAAEKIKQGHFSLDMPVYPAGDLNRLGRVLVELARALDSRYQELQKLNEITVRINSGLLLDDVLDGVYRDFKEFIPYQRIGFALLEENGGVLRARWAKTEMPEVKLYKGYFASMAGSSLETILATGCPRILNDLENYLVCKPQSESTALIVQEGFRSSLTCPLIANGIPVGFMFFSSVEANTYANVHVETFMQIAGQLSVIVEKGRMVSELAENKLAIERQNEELRRLAELKNTFLGIAAHDLRSPIANIQLTSELLLDPGTGLSDIDRQDFLNDIYHQAQYMLQLLNDILDVTRIESGKVKLEPILLEMSGTLQEILHRNARLAELKGSTLLLETVPPGKVIVDPLRMRQMMDNLISNAVKFSPPGSLVTIRAIPHEDYWMIEVQDQGPGISEKDRSLLFQDFARLSARPTGGEKSTGLGLAITRRVVEAHGGRIGVRSEPGHGATFWFTLKRVD